MSLYDEIKSGLEQAIEYEKGNLKARKITLSVMPLESFTESEIKESEANGADTSPASLPLT